jgi:hypothetical protein
MGHRAEMVARTIRRFASESIVLTDPAGVFTVADASVSTAGRQSQTVSCTPPVPYQAELVDRKNIIAGDLHVWIPARGLSWNPVAGHHATFAGEGFRVKSVRKAYVDGGSEGFELRSAPS